MKSYLVVFLFSTSVQALEVTLDDVAGRIRTHHPALNVARAAVAEARGRQLGAGRLANPTLSVDYQNESQVSPRTSGMSIDQAFPLTKKLAMERQLSAQGVAAAELEVKDAERKLIAEAQEQVVRLLTISRQRALRQEQTKLADELAEFASKRAKAGEVSPLDAQQVRLDAQKLIIDARMMETEVVRLVGTLKTMLGLTAAESLEVKGELPVLKMPEPGKKGVRPDYQLAQARESAAGIEQGLAAARRVPDVTAGLFAAREAQQVNNSGRERTGFFGLRFSVPLPLWNKNEGEIAEKAASAARAKSETEALALQIDGETGTAWREMEANASIVAETKEKLLPLAEQQVTDLDKAYKVGQAELLTLLRAREQRIELQSVVLDAERDFHLARIRHQAAIGGQP